MSAGIALFRLSSDTTSYMPGQIVFEAGEPGDLMYVVVEGEVDIVIDGRVIETVGSGGVVGEMAIIDGGPRSATAMARGAARLAPVTARHFMFMVQHTPNFALQVMRVMADRLRRRAS